MSEPYRPIKTESLGIEYIKEDCDSVDWDKIESKRDLYLKKQEMLKSLMYQIRKRELQNKGRNRKRLPLW